MKFSKELIMPIASIVLGLLFVIFQGRIIGISMTILGIASIVEGILSILEKKPESGAINIITGVVVILFGWLLAKAVLYVLAMILIGYGIYLIYTSIKLSYPISAMINPALLTLSGLFLFFNQGGAANWAFIVSGIFFIGYGIHAFFVLKNR